MDDKRLFDKAIADMSLTDLIKVGLTLIGLYVGGGLVLYLAFIVLGLLFQLFLLALGMGR